MPSDGPLSRKHLIAISCTAIGLGFVVAESLWPQYRIALQMALYSFFIFGPLFLGLWPDRKRTNFWAGMVFMLSLHSVLLYAVRSIFPFRNVLTIIPIALVEACVMFLLMLKILGDPDTEQSR
jgi:hypothetical protein